MNNNELIAEFMGMSSFKTEYDTFWHPNEKCTPENWKYHSLDLDNFYPKSWDWIMPVLEKIETTTWHFSKEMNELTIKRNIDHAEAFVFRSFNSKTKLWHFDIDLERTGLRFGNCGEYKTSIEATYNAVVEFIKWYNKQKS